MAEALLRHRVAGVDVTSAGSHPAAALNPHALRVLREDYDIDLEPRAPRALDALAGRRFDCVITLCDKVREVPRDHGAAVTTHWGLPDPSGRAYPEFRRVAQEIDARIAFPPL
jgi:protein-tyrosine-phosphatase